MQVIYQASCSPFGLGVSKVTRSQWSHVVMVFDDGVTFEARAGKGVFKSTKDAALKNLKWVYGYEVTDIKLPDEAAAREFAESCVGQTYDYLALLNFLIPFRVPGLNLDVKSKWFCSELLFAVVKAGGTQLLRDQARYVSPEMAYLSPIQTVVTPATYRPWKEVINSIVGRQVFTV